MLEQVISLRHQLHRKPELSGQERGTAELIAAFFHELGPDLSIHNLGGYGLAFIFEGAHRSGPTVLLRCDMDALPIRESNQFEHRSCHEGVSHLCGHDGHMAVMAAVGQSLAHQRPANGRVVLLYQPAEETGHGAAAVVADPKFSQIRPDYAFALHNVPGYPLGQIILRTGTFSCASRGIEITLHGREAHAAQPETGLSPATATSELLAGLGTLPPGVVPVDELGLITVVGASLGDKAFGTSPGRADIWATLRSERDQGMDRIMEYSESLAARVANAHGLKLQIKYHDIFPATVNSTEAVDIVRAAAGQGDVIDSGVPFRWSEDFGHMTALCDGALFGIGAGDKVADLHNPDYDFPDALIRPASDLFIRIVDACTGRAEQAHQFCR